MPNSNAAGQAVSTRKAEADTGSPLALELSGVERRHGSGRGVGPVDLVLDAGTGLAVIGESGSGKSPLLRVIAGLDRADRGVVRIAGVDVGRSAPGRRDVAFVSQDLPLYDHLDVTTNVHMAVSGLDLDQAARARRVEASIEAADATDFRNRRADQLSGGERARTCLARILARRPAVALLDEPFAGLDRRRRDSVRELVCSTLTKTGTAFLLVTHDPDDLRSVSRSIEIAPDGRLEPTPPTEPS
ncbi:MAG: hypothetical protein CMJ54_07820 [Planctomycetaceae bacterium]|nr:hypothetical protein [Planctomycetaceae bacterium]